MAKLPPIIPEAPKSFKAKSADSASITLSWNKSDNATGYTVQQKNGANWQTVASVNSGETTSVKITKLKAGTSYTFRICANGDENSDYTTLTAATSLKKLASLKVSKKAKTSLTIKWKKNASATGYEIQQKVGKKWKTVKTVSKNKTFTAKITKLKKKTTYTFRVRAFRKVGKKKLYSDFTTIKGKTRA